VHSTVTKPTVHKVISMTDGEKEYLNLKQAWCSESNNPSMLAHDNTEINLRDAALAATSLHLQQM
jgi:hypothetical protein